LAFHDFPSSQVRAFRNKLEIVKEVANIVSLDDIFAGRMSWSKINVAITFDDGYRGWLDNVCPVLKELGISATFFVSSGLVGLRQEEERHFFRNNLRSNRQTTGGLTSEALRKLAEEGFNIGGHTCNHVNVAELDDINELRSEIQKDKKELERLAGTKVKYFAYPFGFYRNVHIDLMQVLQESGYRGAVTLVPGLITAGTNSYYLHRDLVNSSMPMPVFKARLNGNHDGVIFTRKLLRLQGATLDMP
jgi:peptidoglycan/xylan/chitin deacetylase (PgdA/CDA1 family)